jgi:hypothetical protein
LVYATFYGYSVTKFYGISVTNILGSQRGIYVCFLSLIKYYAYAFLWFLVRFPLHWLDAFLFSILIQVLLSWISISNAGRLGEGF